MSVRYEVSDRIGLITLNRPESMNAMDSEMRDQLIALWPELNADDRVHAVIITGAGMDSFCAGADLKTTTPPDTSYAAERFMQSKSDDLFSALTTDKPIIAAVNGYAFGVGLELALACDIRIASETALFAQAEVKWGTIPGAGGTQLLPLAVGPSTAALMLFTGDRLNAQEALRVGLVSELHPQTSLMPRSTEIAERIIRNSPMAVRATKRILRLQRLQAIGLGAELERAMWGLLRNTPDRLEGRAAFTERRDPRYGC